MIINHNIASLNAWQNLSNNNEALNKALERLSSGLRINRAADDAAGLAISEKMRAQINGLSQATSNAQNGISLLQTAEGALSTSENILQRMRQLSLQASADSANAGDRQQMQKEMDQLAGELSRISNTTEFNTKNLLGGAFAGQKFQIGANANQTVTVDIGAMDAHTLGVTAGKGVTIADGNLFTSGSLTSSATATTQAYQVTGSVTAAAAAAKTVDQSAAAAAYSFTLTGATDTITMTANSNGSANNGYTLNVTTSALGAGNSPTVTLSGKQINLTLNSSDTTQNTASNIRTALAGTVSGFTFAVVAGDGAEVTDAGIAASATGKDTADLTFTAKTGGTAGNSLNVVGGAGGGAPPPAHNPAPPPPPTRTTPPNGVLASAGATSASYNSGTQTLTVNYSSTATVKDILDAVNNDSSINGTITASSTNATVSTKWATAQASASFTGGTDASASLNLLDASGATVQSGVAPSSGVATFSNGVKLTVDSTVLNAMPAGTFATQTIDVVAANSNAALAGTNGVINSQAAVTKGILIDTQANAQAAITAIDNAINKVSTSRATLGALQNRLDNTVSNLGITSQNMTAAESRIRDADMAKEMASFTRQQILMQAGTAMLAQANQVPQSVLQLLRG